MRGHESNVDWETAEIMDQKKKKKFKRGYMMDFLRLYPASSNPKQFK
jgi:hypothetical protein